MVRLLFPAMLVLSGSMAIPDPGWAKIFATGLRCEYLDNPLGIDRSAPRLSWIIASKERVQVQTAYRIMVASSRKNLDLNLGDLWDSGKISSDQTVNVPYSGRELRSGALCFWKVKAWDGNGKESSWSKPAFWSMGLLSPGDWQAKWIGGPAHPKVPSFVKGKPAAPGPPASYFRKEFTIANPVRRATLYITARGMFESSLNGLPASQDVLAPEYTDYSKRIQYRTYDVTRQLKQGANVIGAVVGDGWYSGYIGIIMLRDYYGSRTGLLAQLKIEYTDATEQIIATDSSWKCSEGPILFSDMLLGETYDARKEMPGWNHPGFNDSSWKPIEMLEPGAAKLVAQPAQPVTITDRLKPVKVAEPSPNVFVFDLGQNFAGWARLRVKGPAGTAVTLRFAEMVNPDGSIYTENLRNARSTDTYILRGEGEEVYEPHFTFHGFRYVEVTGYPGKPSPDTITGCVITSQAPPVSNFECSNPMVNKLYSNICWGQTGNFISIPTDCPQRDERQGWMGDAQVFIRTATYNRDVSAFFTKWMDDVVDAQLPDGAFADTAPFAGNGLGGPGAPAWGDAGIIVPWTFYRVYGDTLLLRTHYPAMVKWMDYLREGNPDFVRRNHLNGNYGDWLSINANTPKDLLATAYWAYDAALMAKIARIIGNEVDSAKYTRLFETIRAAFQKEYVLPDGHIKGETQTGYLLALWMDLLPSEMRPQAARVLVGDIEKKGGHLSTGFIGVRHLCPVLTRMGYPDVAYRLLNNDTFPSWGYSIKHGATTIWERWNGWTAEKGFFNPGMNSFNHYSLGSVGEWLFESVAGIDLDPEVPAFKNSIIRPVVGGGLSYAKAEYTSIHGRINSGWKLNGDRLTLDVTIPANTTATVYVPASEGAKVTEGGKPAAKAKGLKFVKQENGYAVYEAGSGSYSFASTVKK